MVQAVGWTVGRLLGQVGGWRFPWAWNFRVVVGMDEEGKGRDWLSLLRFGGFAVGGGAGAQADQRRVRIPFANLISSVVYSLVFDLAMAVSCGRIGLRSAYLGSS